MKAHDLKVPDLKRYQPQIQMPGIGIDGQLKLRQAKLLCIGVGGLGNPLLLSLVGAGIGHLTLVDGDLVQLTNLQRQVLFTEADLGAYKVDVAKKRLEALNADVEIDVIAEFVTNENIDRIFKAYDLIIDGTDDLQVRYLLNRKSIEMKVPYVFCGVEGWQGQFACFQPWVNGGCFACLFPEQVGQNQSVFHQACQQRGMIGSVTGLMAAYQANVVIQCLLGMFRKSSILFQVNALDFQVYQWEITRRDGCICQRGENRGLGGDLDLGEDLDLGGDLDLGNNDKNPMIYRLSQEQWEVLCRHEKISLKDLISSDSIGVSVRTYLIDMRERLELGGDEREMIEMPKQLEVLRISFAQLTAWILDQSLRDHLSVDCLYLLVCEHGQRAEVIGRYLLQAGFRFVCLLGGS